MNTQDGSEVWRFDKRISVDAALLILQSIAFVWFMAKMDSRIEWTENDGKTQAAQIVAMQGANAGVIERLARLEEQMRALNTIVNRIDRKLPVLEAQ